MRAISILSRLFANDLKSIHLSRMKAVLFGVEALLSGGRLSLTALGRAARGKTAPKHSIKRIDRLLGNQHLPADIRSFGHAMARWLLGSQKRPLVLVDWTLIGPNHNALVAAIPCDGRALPIYFEVHGRKLLANRKIEDRFLERLRDVLPSGCRPTLVTDAGFRNPWLAKVASMGWDYVSRLTTWVLIESGTPGDWQKTAVLENMATCAPLDLGNCQVGRKIPRTHRVVVAKHFQRNPKRSPQPRRSNHHSRGKKQIQRRSRTPWLLASSRYDLTAKQLCQIYGARMQIEEIFRDTKNHRFGWSFSHARSRSAQRHTVMLLLAALAGLVLTFVGLAAEKKQLHLRYQANTIRKRRVLSLFHLGKTILARARPTEIAVLNLVSASERIKCFEIT